MIPAKMRKVLNYIYNKPASVTLISSPKHGWKTGKTDWGLELTELLDEMKIISKFASNIETKDEPPKRYIHPRLPKLRFLGKSRSSPKNVSVR